LAGLTSASPALAGFFAGAASGQVSLEARGSTRADLLTSLACQSDTRIAGAQLRNISLQESLRDGAYRSGVDQFTAASAAFTCASRSIEFQSLTFTRDDAEIVGSGTIGFAGNLDLRLHQTSASAVPAKNAFRVTGPLAALHVAPIPPPPRRAP
jgi:hypothetical protein